MSYVVTQWEFPWFCNNVCYETSLSGLNGIFEIRNVYLITFYNIEEICAYTNICIYFYFSDLLGPCSIYWRNQWCDSRQMAVFLTFWWHLKSALWYTVKFIYSKATSMCIYVVLQRKKSVSPQWRFLKKNK